MNILLISTYELGHQPFGLASPAAWLESAGFSVDLIDLSLMGPDENKIRHAAMIALYVPMHTATRMVVALLPRLRELNPDAHIVCYGMYAAANAALLRSAGADSFISGEYEQPLTELAVRVRDKSAEPVFDESLDRLPFKIPSRANLPDPEKYAHLVRSGNNRTFVAYTEASRGCKKKCRHCPVVPVYNGALRIVPADVVLADIDQQIERGARHVTFGDPDFFNAPRHVLPIVQELAQRHPGITYDVTIKVEHLLRYSAELPVLKETGCIFITSAVESLDEKVLQIFDKGHSRADFIAAGKLLRDAGLAMSPTFIPFTPWTTRETLFDMLETIREIGLAGNVAPVQWSIRLLIPKGSLLLDRPELHPFLGEFNQQKLSYDWTHPEPELDQLARDIADIAKNISDRYDAFDAIYKLVTGNKPPRDEKRVSRSAIPYLSEPWYC